MNVSDLKFVFESLGSERRVFHYFRDRYAFLMLERLVPEGLAVTDAKRFFFANLLDKPVVREHLGKYGQRHLGPDLFAAAWIEPALPFVIGFAYWRGKANRYCQITRSGLNLVLQLNFCTEHMDEFRRLYKPTRVRTLNFYGHPVNAIRDLDSGRETLAWARIDFDLDTGEALIEEIQTDWCRQAKRSLRYARLAAKHRCGMPPLTYSDGTLKDVERYVVVVLRPYADCWDEAMLSAAITFIRDELGIRKIYYHSVESGAKMKRIHRYLPPRSLYSTLPKRFGFKKTQEVPEFLMEDKSFRRLYKAIKPVTLHRLCLPA